MQKAIWEREVVWTIPSPSPAWVSTGGCDISAAHSIPGCRERSGCQCSGPGAVLHLPTHCSECCQVCSGGDTRPCWGPTVLFKPGGMAGGRERWGFLEKQRHSWAPDPLPYPWHCCALAPINPAWRGFWVEVWGGSAGPTLLWLCWKLIPTYVLQMGHSPSSRLQPANKLRSSWGGEPTEPRVL